jgi:acetyl-CoA carboxylase biotin carboxyl carrier protein
MKMDFKQLQELLKAINKSNLSEVSIEDGDFKITVKQAQTETTTQFVAVQQPMPLPQQALPPVQQAVSATIPAAAPQAPAADVSDNYVTVRSPMIGTFYRSASPDKPAFVNVGDEIKQGQVLCIIEAMKLFNEIESEVSGKIIKVLVDNASPVEYEQPLFLVEP